MEMFLRGGKALEIGKMPENALKRSVLGQIGTNRTKGREVIHGAGVGMDCAVFSASGERLTALGVQEAVILPEKTMPQGGGTAEAFMTMADLVQKCANNMAAGRTRLAAVMIALLMPEGTEETVCRKLMAEAEEKCAELSVEIAGGQTRITRAVTAPVAVVSGYGKTYEINRESNNMTSDNRIVKSIFERAVSGKAAPGQDVVLSKWIGLQGTAVLAKRHREKLLERYPAYLVEEAAGFDRYFSVLPEAEIAVQSGVCAMHDASEGGILGALWELAEGAGVGMTINMRKLPLRQETVEVCEACNVNPYELMAGGCLLMTSRDGPALAAALEAADIPATVVGKITDSNDRILINGDEIRYMNRPERDGIYILHNAE